METLTFSVVVRLAGSSPVTLPAVLTWQRCSQPRLVTFSFSLTLSGGLGWKMSRRPVMEWRVWHKSPLISKCRLPYSAKGPTSFNMVKFLPASPCTENASFFTPHSVCPTLGMTFTIFSSAEC